MTANRDHLSNFAFQSVTKYGVKDNPNNSKEKNMVIFTTAKDIDRRSLEKVLLDKVRVINYVLLSNLTRDNLSFWLSLEDLVVEFIRDYEEKLKS